jgi:predicted phage baseplate assembly protein
MTGTGGSSARDRLYNPPGRTALDYRVGDHESFLAAMIDRLTSPDHPALRGLTVRTTDDPAIAMLDAAAVLGDLLTFHSERIADEAYLRTADESESLELLGRLVGYRPRPALGADTHLAYTVAEDARGADVDVLIPRGARSHSVPAVSGEETQTFETDADLVARAAWNVLLVRRRRPDLIFPGDLEQRSEIFVSGTATGLAVGDRLLFAFGGILRLLPVARLRVDREEDVTAVALQQSPPPTFAEVVAELRQWITEPGDGGGEPTPGNPNPRPVSRLIAEFDTQVLAPLRDELGQITTQEQLAARLTEPLARLREAQALAASASPAVAAWFEQLTAVVAELGEQGAPGAAASARTARTAAAPADALTELLAMRVTAAPFGSTAPLQPVQDEQGRVIRLADWPLPGATLTSSRVVFDPAGRTPVRAEFVHAQPERTVQRGLDPIADTAFDLEPGRIEVRRQSEGDSPGVRVRLQPGLPALEIFVGDPGDDDRRVRVTLDNGSPTELSPGDPPVQLRHGEFVVTVRYAGRTEAAAVEVGVATVPDPAQRTVLSLDAVHSGITVGSRIGIERPRKGPDAPDGVPGARAFALVVTEVKAVRTVAYTRFGITGRGVELTLDDPWLDEHDVLLSHIRDTTVHAAGQALRPAGEPLGEDVHGNEIELAENYGGLARGRTIVISGERTDVPGVAGRPGTELAVVAAVRTGADPELPGDHVHTTLTLTEDLRYRYRRDTVRVLGNVVAASQGESRDDAIGSGDATRAHQTFALWQAPLTWLPDDTPLGASPALEILVDGLPWRRVDGFTGHGPADRVYVLGTAADGRATVTFGDGIHGARLPTGQENVRARYRFGAGAAGNVAAGQITQAVTRPLGVVGVVNPIPATGGADPDGPGPTHPEGPGELPMARRRIPLAVSALDRLVSVPDYADFARGRVGIGRAAAARLYDGRRQVLHVTVAGMDDAPIDEHSDLLPALRAALTEHGDGRLPIRVDVRELVLLVLAAKVKVRPGHPWDLVEPRLRAALLRRLGFPGRELAQPAHLSEVHAVAHTVPGVDWIDVDVFTGITVGRDTAPPPAGGPRPVVPARPALYDEDLHVVAAGGETLTDIAGRYGISVAEVLRLNPGITDTWRLRPGRAVCVFRGIRPAQLTLLSPRVPDTLQLTEVR